MRGIACAILIFLMATATGCQTLRDTVSDIVTFPQDLEKSSNTTVRAASRIGQKLSLKYLRSEMKDREEDRFKADSSYTYQDFNRRLGDIHSGRAWSDRGSYDRGYYFDYRSNLAKDELFGRRNKRGEKPIPIMGNKEITVDDEGSVRVDLPNLYERWFGWKWPFGKSNDDKMPDKYKTRPKYKWDADARLSFDKETLIDRYQVEVGLAKYSEIQRKRQWRLSLRGKYKPNDGRWAFYLEWSIRW